MRFERLTHRDAPMYETALALYGVSFPRHEQRKRPSQDAILANEEYRFTLVYDEEQFVGDILFWETENFIYVEHFCICEGLRGRKYGQRALELLAKRGNTVILEIDPPVDEISIRRKGFYERCGFTANPYPHVHPPYHADCHGHELVIMSSPGPITQREYGAFKDHLDSVVMKDVY